jgi:cellobiose transport system permease protein
MGVLLPNITSIAAVAIIFSQLFARDFGIINYLIHFVGIDAIDWQANRWSSWLAIATMVDWRWTGYNALIFLAALQAVPHDLYESASMDGAGRARQFWSITIPVLRPTLIFVVVISTIGGIQLFAEPLLFDVNPANASGGASGEFQTLALYLYQNGFKLFKFGYAATIGWVMFLIVCIFVVINFLLTRRISSSR